MSVIFCKLDLFDMKQQVQLVSDDNTITLASVDIKDLGQTIATLCDDNLVFKVKIFGTQEYAEDVANDILTCNSVMYKENKLTVEVNQ